MDKKVKREPIRMCCVCREHKEKSLLIRFVVNNGNIIIDNSYKISGRGAYICKNIKCLRKAKKTKALERTLTSGVIIDDMYNNFERIFEGERK